MLPALRSLNNLQQNATAIEIKNLNYLLHYCVSYPEEQVRYYSSDIQLQINSDCPFLSLAKTKVEWLDYQIFSKKMTSLSTDQYTLSMIFIFLVNSNVVSNLFALHSKKINSMLEIVHHNIKIY